MNDQEISKTIESSRDSFGVITESAAHKLLSTLSADDWQKASKIYTAGKNASDCFSISDDASGKVSIHNNLEQAREFANTSVLKSTANDVGKIFDWTVGLTAAGLATWTGYGTLEAASQMGLTAGLEEGVGAFGSGCMIAPFAFAAGAAIGTAADLVKNFVKRDLAANDVAHYADISLQSK